ncbi:MAG: ABC transporter ATP-binding protein [Promethearchaeota archaeon]
MNTLRIIFKYWLKSKKKFIGAFILTLIATIMTSIIPVFIGRIIGRLSPNATNRMNTVELFITFAITIGLAFFSFILNRAARILNANVAAKAIYHVRNDIHDAIYVQSFSYFDKHETGQLIARATSDVEQANPLFGIGLNIGVQAILSLTSVIISVIVLKSPLSWIFAIFIPISLLTSLYITIKLKPIFVESREAFGELTNTIRENIIGAQVVRIFSTQNKESLKFKKNNEKFYDASLRTVKNSSFFMPINGFIIMFMGLLILYFGGIMVINGKMELEALITMQSYTGIVVFPLYIIGQLMIMYVQANAAMTRVQEVLEATPEIKEVKNPISADNIVGDVKFNNVSFGYTTSALVLNDISFHVRAGEKIAILGTTGSGKTTIINLLPRFYDVTNGEILIDDINIKEYSLKGLRKQIGFVSQDIFLFNKSIKDNIKYGKDEATMEDVISVAKTANIHDFILSLPEGYDTIVGERGTRLSGGQKQRLAIARALLIKPKILIFDDSTSSVDVETEYKIQLALQKLMEKTTTFIITQRLSTIRNADKILLLDKGRVVGLGPHDVLINDNVLYKQIYHTLYQKQKKIMPSKIEKTTGKEEHVKHQPKNGLDSKKDVTSSKLSDKKKINMDNMKKNTASIANMKQENIDEMNENE